MTDIEIAKANCIAAWAACPDAKIAWCCHHEVESEILTEPALNRIEYISDYKPLEQQVVRFNNFRPVRCPIPDEIVHVLAASDQARAAYRQAWAADAQALAAYGQASAVHAQALAAYDQAWAAYDQALAACDQAVANWDDRSTNHKLDWPDTTWNGSSIFST